MSDTKMKVELTAPFEILSKHFGAYAEVIEAAKEWRHAYLHYHPTQLRAREKRLRHAVEALQAMEGE